jgi:dolichol-phosphate mannosyltransferase
MTELAIIVPTFKERGNIRPLLDRLNTALSGIEYEVVFVDDDSPDGTAAQVREISATDPKVRSLQRIGRRGLASACIEGMLSTAAPYIAVMDADLQHDETILPCMLETLKRGGFDLVVGSRNVEGGSMGEFAPSRVHLSGLGRKLSNLVCRCEIHDPMSGFFLLDRRFLDEVAHSVSGIGFKILVDLIASSRRPVRIAEVPYTFRSRLHGESKLDILVGMEYLQLLLDKLIGDIIPPRFVIFSLVGAVGAVLTLTVLWTMLHWFDFRTAMAAAAFLAMTLNFFLNNNFTYRDRRLRGSRLVTGLLSFYAACSVGAIITVRFAQQAKDTGIPWYAAGLMGLAVSSVWNFVVTMLFTWRLRRRGALAHRKALG